MRKFSIALVLILLLAVSASALDLNIETVDEGSVQGYHSSLAIDNDGNPHISFVGESHQSLKYAYFDGNEWMVETVFESFDSIEDTSIALNSASVPRIAFTNKSSYPDTYIMYASFNGSTWDIASVDQGNYSSGRDISLAIDSSGDPAIAYILQNKSDSYYTLKYAKMQNGSWVLDTVHADDYMATSCPLVLSSTGVPYICYAYRNQEVELDYFWLDNEGTWQQETVDPGAQYPAGFTVSMALDSNDRPHFVYNENNAGLLKYAFPYENIRMGIVTETGWAAVDYSSIAVDSSGNVHVIYSDDSNDQNIKYALYDGNSWNITSVVNGTYENEPSLALDSSGNPSISYHDHDSQAFDLKYASKNGESWDIQTVPPAGASRGQNPDMELDSQGKPHMVYMTNNDRAIRYASKNGEEWNTSNLVSFEELPLGNYFRSPSLVMVEGDIPHVSFASNDVLTYAVRSADVWEFETVSPDLDTQECDLILDGSGRPHISFTAYDYGLPSSSAISPSASLGRDLFYGTKDGTGWSVEKIDDGEIYKSRIALDGEGSPSVCYFDNIADELRYASRVEGSWDIAIVSSDIYVYAISMTDDESGIPHVAFVARNEGLINNSLKDSGTVISSSGLFYGTMYGDQWIIEKIDDIDSGYGARQVSIVLDSYGNPHITYGTGTTELQVGDIETPEDKIELKYAWFDGDSWHTAVVTEDYLGGFAMYTSLSLDENNLSHLAYFTGTGVNYATLVPSDGDVRTGVGGCNAGSIPAVFGLLMVPLLFLLRR